MAVKSHHTAAAVAPLRERLTADGFVLTVQNGLTADVLAEAVGADRVVSSFINVGADYLGPGRILQGNVAAFHVGEPAGGTITPRVRELVAVLPYARATGQRARVPVGQGGLRRDAVGRRRLRPDHRGEPGTARVPALMIALAREVLAQAPVPVEGFDGFEPDDLEGSLDRLAAFNRRSAKQYSGIYRDLVVRRRKTEIDSMLRDLDGPIFARIGELVHDIEDGRRVNEVANLDELAAFAASLPS